MIQLLVRFGTGGAIGFVTGLAAVQWIKPTTDGGVALIVVVCVLIFAAFNGLLRRGGKRREGDRRSKGD